MRLFPSSKVGQPKQPRVIFDPFSSQEKTLSSRSQVMEAPPIVIIQQEADPTLGQPIIFQLTDSDLPKNLAHGRDLVFDETLYPGADNVEVQILNNRPKDIILDGEFNDRLFRQNRVEFFTSTEEFNKLDQNNPQHAQLQASRLDRLQQSGIEVKFQWGSIFTAYGLITEVNLDWDDLATVKYSFRIMVTRKDGILDVTKKANLQQDSIQIQEAKRELDDTAVFIQNPPTEVPRLLVNEYEDVVSAYDAAVEFVRKAQESYSKVVSAIETAFDAVDRVVNLIRSTIAFVASARSKLAELRGRLDGWVADSKSATNQVKSLLDIHSWVESVRNSAFDADRRLLSSKRSLTALSDSFVLTVHRVVDGDTLFSISQRYYNEPLFITDIMLVNDLTSPNLEPGQLLIIPRRDI